ncbi:MAG: hypothetical protein PHW60_16380 [Kiritimatiellae bacterium]|nr:hypothetical protein [Kiritimatiellia bacterium]
MTIDVLVKIKQYVSVWAAVSNTERPCPPSCFSGLASVVRRLSSGFSLVEVTLALLVMVIGILSIMSMFPVGLDQNIRSIADTRTALFAEEVFAGLHAKAETNWATLAEAQLPAAAANMWNPAPPGAYFTGTNVTTNSYMYKNFEDHVLRYRLVLTTNGLIKAATLFVWPDEFGTTNSPSVFYAEFFRFRP